MPRVVAYMDDLFFQMKLAETAKHLGLEVKVASNAQSLLQLIDPPPDAASAALRDLLVAACAHDEPSFEKFLTSRNAEAFSRLTPTARTELMKRFVLLDGAGKPTISTNPSGRPEIRCTTPDGAADIQLGGTELRENI